MRHARISAYLLLVTGTFHTLIGLVDGYPQFAAMARDGLFGTATASPEREAIFWFLIAGFGFLLSGLLALGFGRPLPASFGWVLLALGLIGTIFIPVSGFLLVVPQAVYVLVAAHRGDRPRVRQQRLTPRR